VDRLRVDSRLRLVCGFLGRVPRESTFSRGFAEFAASGVLDEVLEAGVRTYLGDEIIHHVSHAAAAIHLQRSPPLSELSGLRSGAPTAADPDPKGGPKRAVENT
jgi:hypothetical protein